MSHMTQAGDAIGKESSPKGKSCWECMSTERKANMIPNFGSTRSRGVILVHIDTAHLATQTKRKGGENVVRTGIGKSGITPVIAHRVWR
jgi:hypothetical protein